MHSLYMAGDMASPPTAALDPIFFAFHAYIDFLYEQWLQNHGKDSVTSQNFFLQRDVHAHIGILAGLIAVI